MRVFVLAAAIAVMTTGLAEAGQRWIPPSNVRGVLRSPDNYAPDGNQNYLLWSPGGTALDSALRANSTGSAASYAVSGKKAGTIVWDGQCAGFVRMATNAPGTGNWRRGVNVLACQANGSTITPGTAITTFRYDSVKRAWGYDDQHTALFVGYTSDGGISVWQANWLSNRVSWGKIGPGGTGKYNAGSYFVVETP